MNETIATTEDTKKYYYSEIFHSIQGEGQYTGVPTAWIRFFLCNLQRYKHLMGQETPKALAHKIIDILKTESNPEGLFLHPVSQQRQHFCVTGGEPMMPQSQKAFIGIMRELKAQNNLPASITFETNGTQNLTQEFINFWQQETEIELFFSVSPKLFSTSGELAKKAIRPEVVEQYRKLSSKGQLKFVVGSLQREWDDMEAAIAQFREVDVDFPIWVMPVGAREEEQTATAGHVAKMAFQKGYNVAARVHVYLFGNAIGT